MKKIDKSILEINRVICESIRRYDGLSERGLLSQIVLSQLRNLVEHVMLKSYAGDDDIDLIYNNIVAAIQYAKTRGQLKFLCDFHKFLQKSISHYTREPEVSERLILKYYEYLLLTKKLLKDEYDIEILQNIEDFPLKEDIHLGEYYRKIADRLELIPLGTKQDAYFDRYYIHKIKPFFISGDIYYEVTLRRATDRTSKHDRFIAFTKLRILPNYSVRLEIQDTEVNILNKGMPIFVITDWAVSIRPCELNNFSAIVQNTPINMQSSHKEYKNLMSYLTHNKFSLLDVMELPDEDYGNFRKEVKKNAVTIRFLYILDQCRHLIINNSNGSNVLRYLLYHLNNKVIKLQHNSSGSCHLLSDLNLAYGCIPFDQTPFSASLKGHNPKGWHVLDCISLEGREAECFSRYLNKSTTINGDLFTPISDLEDFGDLDELMHSFNSGLYCKHKNREIREFKNHFFIVEHVENTVLVIKQLIDLTSEYLKGYFDSVENWLNSNVHKVDCAEKRETLKSAFAQSAVFLLYGSAGTGKTTMINHIANFFDKTNKLFLANTNPAVDNLKRKVNASNCCFHTIFSFLHLEGLETNYDILIVDECSAVSNADMVKILDKVEFKLLVLVGDIYQLESIRFGNWFEIARKFVPKRAVKELTKPYRTKDKNLLELWEKVRTMSKDVLEHLAIGGYSKNLDESIFEVSSHDEITLCLNYDGLYGINNVNRLLQKNNRSEAIFWGIHTYKKGDPVLFNESIRFAPVIYNNLKGWIVDIVRSEDEIQFEIELDAAINEFDARNQDFELLENSARGNSIIRFSVWRNENTDHDDVPIESIVPFQVAYAVSIHKAQGLEYDSVKIIITDEVGELITHNIFYTAITRAKRDLKIYWSPETENRVLSSFEKKEVMRDISLLAEKYNLKTY